MIAIIDYDMGNVGSIKNIFHHIGADRVLITRNRNEIGEASHIVLPGVGAFDSGMLNLKKLGLDKIIKEEVLENKKPILGICLGMQLLGRMSEEGQSEGLGLIDFDSVKFNLEMMDMEGGRQLKIPHMGWNYVNIEKKDDRLVTGLDNSEQRYYFVHSYHAICDNGENVLMSCDYGYRFTAAVAKEKIYGVQFHPEKSHKYGMELLRRFSKI